MSWVVRRSYLFAFLVIALMMTNCWSRQAAPEASLEERIGRVENGLLLTETISDRMASHHVPGLSMAVINNYEVEWTKGYGVLEKGGGRPVTSASLFQAASIAKPVTAVGVLHHVERGILDLDEDVNQKLVSWKLPENEFTAQADVTLRRLLSHTAGVNQGLYRGYAPGEGLPTMQQVLEGESPANSPPVRVDRIPGTKEHYSNGGYLIVAQLLEDVLERSFSAAMQEAVFAPIGMTSSTFEPSLPEELAIRAATAHGWDVDAWTESPGLRAPGKWHINDVGMSGLWTTASDLALFTVEVMRAYKGESDLVLSKDMARLMLTPVAESIPLQEPFEADQALGFSLIDIGQETWLIHFGGAFPGYIAGLIAQPERGFGIVVLTNAWSGYEVIWEIFYSVFYAYGILPSTGQVLNMGYSLLLFLVAFALWPGRYAVRRYLTRRPGAIEKGPQRSKTTTYARLLVALTVISILVITYLYRGPLGGALVNAIGRGETPFTKGLLGLFFSTPIFLVGFTIVVWKDRSQPLTERVLYTLVIVGTLVGVYLLRDLWGLMFWG